MPDLSFQVEDAQPVRIAASPLLALRLRISNTRPEEAIHAILLRSQVQIEATRRRYSAGDQAALVDLFGEPERWGQSLRGLLWTHTSVIVPSFTGTTLVELQLPCTYDLKVASAKYFSALEEGEVPLCLLFSGTIFYRAADAALQVAQIPWDKEASYRLPVRVWQEVMDLYFPNSAWLSLRKDVFERLVEYKSRNGLPTWEHAIDNLLQHASEQVTP